VHAAINEINAEHGFELAQPEPVNWADKPGSPINGVWYDVTIKAECEARSKVKYQRFEEDAVF